MSPVSFEVVGARVEAYAAVPTLMLRLRITAADGEPVHAIALRCQIMIEPKRRHYDPDEEHRLTELFGETPRWGDTLRPFLWTNVSHHGRRLHRHHRDRPADHVHVRLRDRRGQVHALARRRRDPDRRDVLRHGVRTQRRGLNAAPVSWSEEASYRLPVSLWRDMMDLYFPNTGWLRLRRETLDALQRYKAERALLTWDETVRAAAEGSRGGRVSLARPPTGIHADRFAVARLVADTVLYEGYVLYPYRASAQKNQLRWQFGVLAPPRYAESSRCRAMVDAQRGDRRPGRAATLHRSDPLPAGATPRRSKRQRTTERRSPPSIRSTSTERTVVPWDEAIEHEIDVDTDRAAAGRPARQGARVRAARRRRGRTASRPARRSWVGRSRQREEVRGLVRISARHVRRRAARC